MPESSLEPQNTRVNVYKGPKEDLYLNKSFERINREVFFQASETADQVLALRVQEAIASNRNTVVLLDIGSGKGGFLKGIVDPDNLPSTMALLEENKAISLRVVGFTDSEDVEQFGKPTEDEFPTDKLPDGLASRVKVENYYYSVTPRQTLERFLDDQNIPNLDLVIAGGSLLYFSPKAFDETVLTTTDRLVAGGIFLIRDIVGLPPGYRYDSELHGYTQDYFDVQSTQKWHQLLKINNSYRHVNLLKDELKGQNMTESEIEAAAARGLDMYKRLGVLDDEIIDQIKNELEADDDYMGSTKTEQAYVLANRTLSQGFSKLFIKRYKAEKSRRVGVLESLPSVNIETYRLGRTSQPLYVLKKEGTKL